MYSASALTPTPYVFTPNSTKNTTLSANTHPLYTITTNLVANTHAHIDDDQTRRRIATITRRDFFPDTVASSDRHHHDAGKPIGVRKWLRKHALPDGYPAHAMQTSAGKLVWKFDATHRLGCTKDTAITHTQPQCIAHLQPASDIHPLTLFVDPTAEPFRDEILVACLILEQHLRVAERNISVAGGKFERNKTVFGHHVHT